MTTVPDTITLPADDMAALIVRCAIQLASLSIRQLDRDAKGWTAQERAEVMAHAEKATPVTPAPDACPNLSTQDCPRGWVSPSGQCIEEENGQCKPA